MTQLEETVLNGGGGGRPGRPSIVKCVEVKSNPSTKFFLCLF